MQTFRNVIGENLPDLVSSEVQQNYNDTCAIKSQQIVLEDFGIHRSEPELIEQAKSINAYIPGAGTSPEDVGKLLEMNGVHCTQHQNATVFDLTSALAQGEKVIIGVDSAELWHNAHNDLTHGEQADHALIVAGIDTTDPNNVQVILTDPGTGQEGARYPMAQFLDAWHDSGNFMVTTNTPAPLAYNPEMVNFDYDSGHIHSVGHIPYDYFHDVILPIANDLPVGFNHSDLFFDNFDNMLDGSFTGFSPELIDALQHHPNFSIPENIDLNHHFVPHHNPHLPGNIADNPGHPDFSADLHNGHSHVNHDFDGLDDFSSHHTHNNF